MRDKSAHASTAGAGREITRLRSHEPMVAMAVSAACNGLMIQHHFLAADTSPGRKKELRCDVGQAGKIRECDRLTGTLPMDAVFQSQAVLTTDITACRREGNGSFCRHHACVLFAEKVVKQDGKKEDGGETKSVCRGKKNAIVFVPVSDKADPGDTQPIYRVPFCLYNQGLAPEKELDDRAFTVAACMCTNQRCRIVVPVGVTGQLLAVGMGAAQRRGAMEQLAYSLSEFSEANVGGGLTHQMVDPADRRFKLARAACSNMCMEFYPEDRLRDYKDYPGYAGGTQYSVVLVGLPRKPAELEKFVDEYLEPCDRFCIVLHDPEATHAMMTKMVSTSESRAQYKRSISWLVRIGAVPFASNKPPLSKYAALKAFVLQCQKEVRAFPAIALELLDYEKEAKVNSQLMALGRRREDDPCAAVSAGIRRWMARRIAYGAEETVELYRTKRRLYQAAEKRKKKMDVDSTDTESSEDEKAKPMPGTSARVRVNEEEDGDEEEEEEEEEEDEEEHESSGMDDMSTFVQAVNRASSRRS